LHHFGRQFGHGQALLDAGGNCAVGIDRLGTATQDGGIAGLEAQARGVNGHVRSRLIDDADHAQGHAHLADLNTGRQVTHIADFTDGVRQLGHLTQAFDHVVDTCRGQRQTVQQGRFQAIGAAVGQVQFVGRGEFGARSIQSISGGQQGTVLLRGARTGDQPRGLTGSATQAGHVVKNGLSHGQGVLAKRKAADYSCDAARLTAVRGGWSK